MECPFYYFWGVLNLVVIAQNFRTPEKSRWFKGSEHATWGNFQNPLFAFLRLECPDIFGGLLNSKSEIFLLYINGVVCKVENGVVEDESELMMYCDVRPEGGGVAKWGV